MTTMFEECTIKEQHSLVRFMWANGLNAKDIHKEMFPIYSEKYLSHKVVNNWIDIFSERCSKVTDDA
jgi:hypothetical protein